MNPTTQLIHGSVLEKLTEVAYTNTVRKLKLDSLPSWETLDANTKSFIHNEALVALKSRPKINEFTQYCHGRLATLEAEGWRTNTEKFNLAEKKSLIFWVSTKDSTDPELVNQIYPQVESTVEFLHTMFKFFLESAYQVLNDSFIHYDLDDEL